MIESSILYGEQGGIKYFWILSKEANAIIQIILTQYKKVYKFYTSSDTYSKHRIARNLSKNQVTIILISPTNSITMSTTAL